MSLSAIIIGLGRIGQGEEGRPDWLWTHAAALQRHGGFRLAGGVDPDPIARHRFTRTYCLPAWPSLIDAPDPGADVYVISTPAIAHSRVFWQVLLEQPKAIICEKPLATTFDDAEAMVQAAENADIPLLVNYMRRFDPNTERLRAQIEEHGAEKMIACYSNGWLENGSHYVDLLAHLLPDYADSRVLAGHGQDLDVYLRFGDTTAYLLSLSVGQVEPLFIARHGMFGFELSSNYQLRVLDALIAHLDDGTPLASNGRTALETLRICKTVEACLV